MLLVLALLIGSWLLRTCAPVGPETEVSTLETSAPPAPPAPPDPTPLLQATLADGVAEAGRLEVERAALAADLQRRLAQCRPPEPKVVAPPKPVEPPSPPPKPAPLPADRWAQKDLGLLQGCWRLGQDTQGTMASGGRAERCTVRAGRICFGSAGGGQREQVGECPSIGTIRCTAPVTARFGNDGTLGTTQPQVRCQPGSTTWSGDPNSLTCRRVSDTLAVCHDRLGFQHEFRRE